MKKEVFLFRKRISILITIVLFFIFQTSYSQCPTGDSTQEFCAIDNPNITDLVVIGNNIVWYDASTGGNQYTSETPLTSGSYYAFDTASDPSCTDTSRLEVVVTIYGNTPTNVDVFVGKCASEGATIADLSATGSSIQWYDAQTGGNLLSPSDLLEDGVKYWVQQTENGCTSSRLPTTVTLIDPLPPTSNAAQSFCQSDNPTVADLITEGTVVLWYDSLTSTNPLDDDIQLINGEDYWATEVDFPCESTSRTQVTVSIDPTPYAGVNNSYIECEANATITNLFSLLGTSVDENGTWSGPSTLSNGHLGTFDPGTNAAGTYNYTVNSDLGICPSASASITVTINTPTPPIITQTTQAFCESDNATVNDLTPNTSNIVWYDDAGNVLTSDTPLENGKTYSAGQTQGFGTITCESDSKTDVMVVINAPTPPVIAQTTQAFCESDNATVNDLTPSAANIVWYDDAGNVLTSDTPLENGKTYSAGQTQDFGAITCESVSKSDVTVVILNPVTPTTTNATPSFCLALNPTISDLSIETSNIDYTFAWYSSETSTSALSSNEPLVDGTSYYAAEIGTVGCESPSRLMVTVTLTNEFPVVISNVSQSFCVINAPTVANLDASGTNIIWYASETETIPLNTTDLLIDGEDYWAVQSNPTSSCESAVRVVTNVTLTNPGTPTISALGNEFCIIDNPTVSDLNINISPVNGGTLTWYDSYPDGSILSLSEFLIEGETYYAVESDTDGCSSVNPLEVTVSLESCDQYDIDVYDGFSPTGNGINDTFKIGKLKELYPNYKVEFYNRWGKEVYTSNASKPDWNGRLHGDGELVPSGVYYFVIYFNKNNRKPMQRRLYLSR